MPEKDMNQRFTTNQKMTMVAKSWEFKGEELGRYLRENGISSVELRDWGAQMKDGMNDGKPLSRHIKKQLEQRISILEEELRKAQGIIELQKKAQKIWEEEEARKAQAKSEASSSKASKK